MFGFCSSNIPYDTISVNQPNQLNNQITICDSRYDSKYSLESLSLKYYNLHRNALIEYSINVGVFTKSERNLENMKNQYYRKYDSIIVDDKKITLLKPVVFFIEQDNKGYYFTNSDLNIIASGDTFENAEKDMYEEFIVQWELYANEDNENLTSKTQIIKKNLLESIKL